MDVSVKFEFDQRAINKIANEAAAKVASEAQRAFDRVHRSHSGQPFGQVMPALRSALRSIGWRLLTRTCGRWPRRSRRVSA